MRKAAGRIMGLAALPLLAPWFSLAQDDEAGGSGAGQEQPPVLAEGREEPAESDSSVATGAEEGPGTLLAQIDEVSGRLAEAPDAALERELEGLWQELLAAFPNHPEALLANGDRLYDAGSYDAAAQAYARGATAAPADARFPNRQGNCLFALEDYRESVPLYRASLQLRYDPVVAANLAGAQDAAGNELAAAATWRRHLGQHPDDAELIMQYGLYLFDRGDFAGALDQYQRGQRLEPANDAFFNRAGLCLFELGQASQAVEQVQKALELRADPLYYYNLAIGYEELGEPGIAGRYYREGIEAFPGDGGLLQGYAEYLIDGGDAEEALELLNGAASLIEGSALFAGLAGLAHEQGQLDIADEAYLAALRLCPADAWLHVSYALFLAGQGRSSELFAHLKSARQQIGEEDYAWLVDELGAHWIDAEEYAVGADFMERLVSLDPAEPTAYTALAMFQQLGGDAEAALSTVKRGRHDARESYFLSYLEAYLTSVVSGAEEALALAADLIEHPQADSDAYTLYLDLLDEVGDYPAQAGVARRGLAEYPESAALLGYLAVALFYTGHTAGAIDVLEDPAYAELEYEARHEVLGYCYVEEGNYVKAVAHLSAAVQADEQSAYLWADLGQAQYFLGELESARASLTRALALDEYSTDGHLWLGLVLLDQGDAEGAEVAFDAVETSPYTAPMTLAWLALGQARLALDRGDSTAAEEYLDEAEAYGSGMPRFDLLLKETRQKAAR